MLAVSVNWSLILDYIQVLIWPVIVAGIVAYLLWRYNTNVGNLIDRIKSVEGPWGKALFHPEGQQDSDTEEAAAEEAVANYNGLVDTLVEAYEQAANTEAALTRELALKDLQLDFERIYRVIYGSQVDALRQLRQLPSGSDRDTLRMHFLQAQAAAPPVPALQARTFEAWLAWLISIGLIEVDSMNQLHLTTKGSAFLDYIDASGYPQPLF
jgi:hypothetical protein